MSEPRPGERLSIRLTTAKLPKWARSGVAALRRMPSVEVHAASHGTDDRPVDVVLSFGNYSETARQQFGSARLGFWFFRFAGQDIGIDHAARFAAACDTALEASLWATLPDGSTICLYQSFGQNDAFAPWRTAARSLAKAAHFPARAVARYLDRGELVPANAEETVTTSPSAGLLAQAIAIGRKVILSLFCHEQWFIVAGKGSALLPDPAQGQWSLNPPADCFWADPFPVEHHGRVWVLMEVLPFSTQCGYLAAVELFADGSHSDARSVMNTGRHLSYPFVFKWQGDLYMVPEAGASREVALWKCEELPDRWTKAATLLTGVRFSDATLVEHDGLWWLFLTLGTHGIWLADELSLYHADSPMGPWTAHGDNPVKSDARSARPAGNLVHRDGVLYRPAQDCGTGYGKATVLNRVDRLDRESFNETAVGRIDASWRKDCLRTHTLSFSENYWAVDGLRLLPRWAKLFNSR